MRKFITCLLTIAALGGTAHAGDHPHHAALFVGATTTDAETRPTVGVDYAYRFGLLSVGGLVDAAFGDHTTLIVAPVLFVHPAGGLKIGVAPGLETDFDHAVFVIRGTMGYDFHVGALSVGPVVSVDYADGHVAFVYGAGVGIGF